MAESGFQVIQPPRVRRIIRDSGWLARHRYLVSALISVDVTDTRKMIQSYRQQTGKRLSLTAYVIYCVGQAVAADRMIHAMRDWRNRLVVFDDVDVLMTIEIDDGASRIPVVHPIRAVDNLAPAEIDREIRFAKNESFKQKSATEQWRRIRRFALLPDLIRHIVYRIIYQSPRLLKKYAGTVDFTAVGMFGRAGGWELENPTTPWASSSAAGKSGQE